MMPKSWTGPTLLAMSEPKPITSVAMAPATGQSSVAIADCRASSAAAPSPRSRRYSTITCVTVLMPTTVTIAESIVETMVSLSPATASRPRVDQSARSTTARGTTSQRRLRKQASRTAPASRPLSVPSRLPSRSSIAKPSRSIAGSPASVPMGRSVIRARNRSIVPARETACARCVVALAGGGSSTQAMPAVRWSAPTT